MEHNIKILKNFKENHVFTEIPYALLVIIVHDGKCFKSIILEMLPLNKLNNQYTNNKLPLNLHNSFIIFKKNTNLKINHIKFNNLF